MFRGRWRPKSGCVIFRYRVEPAKEFLFLFDYGDQWEFGVRLMEKGETVDPHAIYPRIVASLGEAPEQYPDLDSPWFDDDEATEPGDDDDDNPPGSVMLNFPLHRR